MIVARFPLMLLLLVLLQILSSLLGPTVFCGKFCQISWASSQNSVAYRGLPLVHKLSFILFKKLQFLDAGMAVSYSSNI